MDVQIFWNCGKLPELAGSARGGKPREGGLGMYFLGDNKRERGPSAPGLGQAKDWNKLARPPEPRARCVPAGAQPLSLG